jgi:hypothetical protein
MKPSSERSSQYTLNKTIEKEAPAGGRGFVRIGLDVLQDGSRKAY